MTALAIFPSGLMEVAAASPFKFHQFQTGNEVVYTGGGTAQQTQRQIQANNFTSDMDAALSSEANGLSDQFAKTIDKSVREIKNDAGHEAQVTIEKFQRQVERDMARDVARLEGIVQSYTQQGQVSGAFLRHATATDYLIEREMQRLMQRESTKIGAEIASAANQQATATQTNLAQLSAQDIQTLTGQIQKEINKDANSISSGTANTTVLRPQVMSDINSLSASLSQSFTTNAQNAVQTALSNLSGQGALIAADEALAAGQANAKDVITEIQKDAERLERRALRRAMRSQSLALVSNSSLLSQFNQVLSKGGSQLAAAEAGAIFNGAQVITLTNQLSVFSVSGVSWVQHDGYKVTSNGITAQGFGFDAISEGLTVGARYDLSSTFSLRDQSLVAGIIGNYSRSWIGIGSDPDMQAEGIQQVGNGRVDNYSIGFYAVFTLDPYYVIGFTSLSWGFPYYASLISDYTSSFKTRGSLSALLGGTIIPVTDDVKLDLRSGLIFAASKAGTYSDSDGLVYSNSNVEDLSAQISAKLFSVVSLENISMRPFVQVGAAQRLYYTNEISIVGVPYSFLDAGQQAFGRIGVDFEFNSIQSYIAVGGAMSSDSRSLSAQIGFTLKTN